jgi:hypothetical protein
MYDISGIMLATREQFIIVTHAATWRRCLLASNNSHDFSTMQSEPANKVCERLQKKRRKKKKEQKMRILRTLGPRRFGVMSGFPGMPSNKSPHLPAGADTVHICVDICWYEYRLPLAQPSSFASSIDGTVIMPPLNLTGFTNSATSGSAKKLLVGRCRL